MSESKLKSSLTVSVSLTPAQRVTLLSVLNFVNRCGACGTIATQGEGNLQIKRYNQILVDLDLLSIDDLSMSEQETLASDNVSTSDYFLKLEQARHLQTVLDTKTRFSPGGAYLLAPLIASLEAQVPKTAAEMDEEATAAEKPPLGRFILSLSPEERELLIRIYFNPLVCLKCACVSDGPATRKDNYLFCSSFKALGLEAFFDKKSDEIQTYKKENPDSIDVIVNLDEATFVHDLVFRRIGFVPKAPRKLAKFLRSIEEIKGGTYERKVTDPIKQDPKEVQEVFAS